MSTGLKFGRRPARYTRASMIRSQIVAMNFALLGPPPANSDDYTTAVGDDWGMFLNDQYGDCTIADCAHQIMLRTANASSIVVPTDADVKSAYFNLTGGADNGLDELTVCQFMQKTGLLGHTTDAYANLDPTNLNNQRWTVQLYGCSRLGIACTDTMMDQFDNGQPWEPVAGAQVEGGHDVPVVKYTTDGFTTMYFVVTWGKLHPVTEAWFKWVLPDGTPIVEEAHVEAADDFLRATGVSPSGLDHDQMIAEMSAVAE